MAQLLLERDAVMNDWAAKHPERDIWDDRDLETLSEIDIDIDR